MAKIIQMLVQPPQPDEVFASDAFASQIGKRIPLCGWPGGTASALVVNALVRDGGRDGVLELELEEHVAKAIWDVGAGEYRFTAAAAGAAFAVDVHPIPAEPPVLIPGRGAWDRQVLDELAEILEGATIANRHRHEGTVLAATADLLAVIADGGRSEWDRTRTAAVNVARAIRGAMVEPLAVPGRYATRLARQETPNV
jgi:hypothetical protein